MSINKATLFLVFLLSMACSEKKNESKSDNDNSTMKPVTELNYSEIVDAVVTGVGEPIEYHGEPTVTEALGDVSIVIRESESCGERACGQSVYIKNSGSQSIKALVRSPFQIGSFDSYAARVFKLGSGVELLIGCSNFCYAGETYLFTYNIIGAEYFISESE